MDAEMKTKWVNALRGGEYKQARGWLHLAGGHFCCLGVLCDLVDPSKWSPFSPDDDNDVISYGAQSTAWPPDEIFLKLDIPITVAEDAASMNDYGKSFAEIADFIEQSA